ncbi:MAG: hypothetical protein JWO46_2775, partial [Nocardioidaceae bacterium]|nr:hypothetical protein [Nocardioidaceae bacterium]
ELDALWSSGERPWAVWEDPAPEPDPRGGRLAEVHSIDPNRGGP